MRLVLDASMAISWMFADEQNDRSRAALKHVLSFGATVPSLWRVEVANVLRTSVKRRRCDAAYAEAQLSRLSLQDIVVDENTHHRAWTATWSLAMHHDLTLYDAAYLELAQRKKLPLASNDRALLDAARSLAVELFRV